MASKPFKGVIKLDVRDSRPDWTPSTLAEAPKGAPNILIVLNDDTGQAAWQTYGGPEQKFVPKTQRKPGHYTVGMEFTREKAGEHGESLGKTKLYVNDKVEVEGDMRTQLGKFTLSGDGLCIGRDGGDAVSEDYTSPGEFKGGEIGFVGVTVEKTQYLGLEKLAAAAFAVD